MHQLNLPDQVYQAAARQAKNAGFHSIEDYFAELVQSDSTTFGGDDVDHRFTPKVLQALDEAAARMDAGKVVTVEQARAAIAEERKAWLKEKR